MAEAAKKKITEEQLTKLAQNVPPAQKAPAPPVPPLLTAEEQAYLVRENDIGYIDHKQVLSGLMNYGVPVTPDKRISGTFQPRSVKNAIAQLFEAADRSNGSPPRYDFDPEIIATQKIDAPFKDILTSFNIDKADVTDENAKRLATMITEVAEKAPEKYKAILPITGDYGLRINSSKVAVAAFKKRAVDDQCSTAKTPVLSDAQLREKLRSVFVLNQQTPEGFKYSDSSLGESNQAGQQLADRYCSDHVDLVRHAPKKPVSLVK